jgi:hypothetical protein
MIDGEAEPLRLPGVTDTGKLHQMKLPRTDTNVVF